MNITQDITGKTITFNYSKITIKAIDMSDESEVEAPSFSDFHTTNAITFDTGNLKKYDVPSYVDFQKGGVHIMSHEYIINGENAPYIEESSNQDEGCVYELMFKSSSSGVARYVNCRGTTEYFIEGITFSIS